MSSGAEMHAYLGESTDYLAVFGVVCAVYFGFRFLYPILNAIKVYFLARSLGLSANLKTMGVWAVITGATDGLGKAYAEQLAQKGLNIVLVSRSAEKLRRVADEIETKYNVKTKVIKADFSNSTDVYSKIRTDLADMDIGVLVNNVGMGHGYPEYFLDIPNREELFLGLIDLNIKSMTMMTSIVLPGMVKRKKGAVINISSMSGMYPVPLITVYSATKAYADFFSVCLQGEYRSRGIIVQSVCPGPVETKMSGVQYSPMFIPVPNTYVSSALGTVGLETRTVGYWGHSLLAWLMTNLPSGLHSRINKFVLLTVRSRHLEKKQREGKSE